MPIGGGTPRRFTTWSLAEPCAPPGAGHGHLATREHGRVSECRTGGVLHTGLDPVTVRHRGMISAFKVCLLLGWQLVPGRLGEPPDEQQPAHISAIHHQPQPRRRSRRVLLRL